MKNMMEFMNGKSGLLLACGSLAVTYLVGYKCGYKRGKDHMKKVAISSIKDLWTINPCLKPMMKDAAEIFVEQNGKPLERV